MQTLIKLLNNTTDFANDQLRYDTEPWADACTVTKFRYKPGQDRQGRPCIIVNSGVISNRPNPEWASGRVHYQEIRLYPPYKFMSGMFMAVWQSCDCEDFCVHGSSRILTSRGLIRIEDCIGNDEVIDTISGPNNAIVYYVGSRPTYRVRVDKGYSITCTDNERFLTVNKELDMIWKEARDLTPNDYVAIKRGGTFVDSDPLLFWEYEPGRRVDYIREINGVETECSGHQVWCNKYKTPIQFNKDLARVLGYLIAEGCGDSNSIKFTQKFDDVLADFVEIWYRCFPDSHLCIGYQNNEKKVNIGTIDCRSVYLIQFFSKALGYDTTSKCHNKYVPEVLFRSTQETVIEFLKAYFEGDGCNTGTQVTASTASGQLARDIQSLLLLLGIVASVSFDCADNDRWNDQYVITMSGDDYLKYMSTVGFISDKKNSVKMKKSSIGTRSYRVPYAHNFVRESIKGIRTGTVNKDRSAWKQSFLSHYGETIHRTTVLKYLETHGDNLKHVNESAHTKLVRFMNEDIVWLKVSVVTATGADEPVYDASVITDNDDRRNFTANGFVVHNCFRREVVLNTFGSSDVNYSNGKQPNIRNPRRIPGSCKHCVAVLKDVLERFKANEDIYWDARTIEKKVARNRSLLARMPGKPSKSRLESTHMIDHIIDTILDEGYDSDTIVKLMF